MRKRTKLLVLFGSLWIAAGSSLTGCATTGTERATQTSNTMQTVEGEYRQVSLQVDATNASLQNLISPEQTDQKKAFNDYRDQVDRMQKLGEQLDKHTADMRRQGQEYFAEWEKQGSTFSNPRLRALSEERRAELRQTFARIPEASIGVKGSLQSYLTDIGEIRKYLSNDLTPSGIEAIRPVARKAMLEGEDLKISIRPVLDAIDRARRSLEQGGAGRGSAPGGVPTGEELPAETD